MSTRIERTPIKPDNTQWMIENNLHPPFISIDKSIFRNTVNDKELIKIGKSLHKKRIAKIKAASK